MSSPLKVSTSRWLLAAGLLACAAAANAAAGFEVTAGQESRIEPGMSADAVRAALGTPDNADVIRHAGDLLTAAREYLDATEQWLASDIPTLRQEQRQERARAALDQAVARHGGPTGVRGLPVRALLDGLRAQVRRRDDARMAGVVRERLREAGLGAELSEEAFEDTAHKVGIAALKFADLQNFGICLHKNPKRRSFKAKCHAHLRAAIFRICQRRTWQFYHRIGFYPCRWKQACYHPNLPALKAAC